MLGFYGTARSRDKQHLDQIVSNSQNRLEFGAACRLLGGYRQSLGDGFSVVMP
jgi:hypothetical protein